MSAATVAATRRPAAGPGQRRGSCSRRIADGNRDALGELYRRHRGTVRGYVLGRIARPDDADDVVQETFLRAAQPGRPIPVGAVPGAVVAALAGRGAAARVRPPDLHPYLAAARAAREQQRRPVTETAEHREATPLSKPVQRRTRPVDPGGAARDPAALPRRAQPRAGRRHRRCAGTLLPPPGRLRAPKARPRTWPTSPPRHAPGAGHAPTERRTRSRWRATGDNVPAATPGCNGTASVPARTPSTDTATTSVADRHGPGRAPAAKRTAATRPTRLRPTRTRHRAGQRTRPCPRGRPSTTGRGSAIRPAAAKSWPPPVSRKVPRHEPCAHSKPNLFFFFFFFLSDQGRLAGDIERSRCPRRTWRRFRATARVPAEVGARHDFSLIHFST